MFYMYRLTSVILKFHHTSPFIFPFKDKLLNNWQISILHYYYIITIIQILLLLS